MKIYKDYTQEELDLQYNVRAGIPETEEIFARWQNDSAATRRRLADRLREDLRYGDDPAQGIDFFAAAKSGQPLVVFIHGGYWQSLDKAHFSYLAEAYVDNGLNFATIDYRLTPSVSMDEIVEDCRQAIAYLARHAVDLGFDLDRFFITGSSAGGHLVAAMASTDWSLRGLPADLITGGCALSGLYDLEPIRLCYLNKVIGMDQAMAHRCSPTRHVPSNAPPLLLSYGGAETQEFDNQQEDFAAAWRAQGNDCTIMPQSDGHHFDMVDRLGDNSTALFKAVHEMVESTPSRIPSSVGS